MFFLSEIVYGYCKECGCLVPAREVFLCKWCKDSSLFQRKSAVPLNHFAREIDPELLKGSCSGCNKDDLEVCKCFEHSPKRVGVYTVESGY